MRELVCHLDKSLIGSFPALSTTSRLLSAEQIQRLMGHIDKALAYIDKNALHHARYELWVAVNELAWMVAPPRPTVR